MVINNEAKHLKKNSWYITDTTVDHTAINASKENRMHMVACILGERNVIILFSYTKKLTYKSIDSQFLETIREKAKNHNKLHRLQS